MKGTYKRIAAITLSLAMIAENAGTFLKNNYALTAKALTVTAAEAQGKDESYYDAETGTLHLKGYVRNNNGVVLPNGVERKEVRHMIAEEGTVLPVNCSHLCEGFIHILSMDFSKADTSNVTDMSYMFMPFEDISNCYSLGVCCYGIDVSNFDTSNVTTMKGMFKNCIEVPELDLSSFDTSKVTDMSEMFSCCGYYYYEGPQSLDLSSFDTSEVKDMSKMFYECEALREIDLSRFDTSNVTDMSDMFNSCRHLLTFDLSNFDTSKVTNMKDMFCNCTDLNSLNISSFNTSKVTNMSGMFQQCYSLKNADLSNFNTSQVTDMSRMFYVNVLFKDIDVSSFDTSNVTDMNFMFSNCVSLESLDLRNFDTHKVTDMRYMFDNCRRLKFVDLSSFDTRNVSNMYCMFNGDSVLETIMVGQEWSTELASGNNMFSSCKSLVGCAGTSYDANHEGLEYAHVDGGKNDPGYLTLKDNNFFKTQNLTLSGQIGVSFNLDLSSLTDQERNASYMEFKINGRTSKVPFDKNSKNASGKYYSFTCYVTSVEMADTITAVFHYGNGNTISKKYSVLDYINAIEKNASSFDNKTLYLIRSIADYGHYSQPFLAASNNWTIGKEHKEMSKHYTNSYSYDAIRNVTSKYQRVLDLGKSDIEKITYSLSLNSGTSLNVFIKAKDNYKGSVKVTTKKGNTVTSYAAVKQSDGRYKVTIPDISAHQLGDMYTITASTTNGTATCSLSALSYVYAVLNGNSDKTAKNAVSSLYIYYDATLNYRFKA